VQMHFESGSVSFGRTIRAALAVLLIIASYAAAQGHNFSVCHSPIDCIDFPSTQWHAFHEATCKMEAFRRQTAGGTPVMR
jgi:hypothetical protein